MYEAESRLSKAKKEPANTAAAADALTDDDKKTKKQLVDELAGLRQRIRDLEAFETERKAIATELKGTRQRLQYLLAVSPAIIYTTKATGDYACTFVSENLRAIMGYTPQEMTTDPKGWPDHLHPEDATRAFGEMLPLIGRGGGSVEYRFRHRDGHYIWIQDTFKVVYDDAGRPLELVGAWADITERKKAEQLALAANAEIQETKRYLTRLIESSPDAIIATDKHGTVVLFNEGAESLLGYRAEDVIGRPTTGLYDSEDRAKDVLTEMRKRGGTASGYESVLQAKDGRSVPVLISASVLLDQEGQEAGMVGFATDLRARKREEEELRKAHDELEKRVEDRTTELKGARERLRYLMTVTPAIVYTNQAKRLYLHLRQRERLAHHGLFRLGDARGQRFLDRAPPSRRRRARVRGDGAFGREGWRDAGVPLPPPRRTLYLDPGHLPRHPRRPRSPARDRRLVGGYFRPQESRDGAWRTHGGDERSRDAGRREPGHHLHHASIGRLRLHLRERELECDHGLCAMGDARRQEILGQASPPGGRQSAYSPSSSGWSAKAAAVSNIVSAIATGTIFGSRTLSPSRTTTPASRGRSSALGPTCRTASGSRPS